VPGTVRLYLRLCAGWQVDIPAKSKTSGARCFPWNKSDFRPVRPSACRTPAAARRCAKCEAIAITHNPPAGERWACGRGGGGIATPQATRPWLLTPTPKHGPSLLRAPKPTAHCSLPRRERERGGAVRKLRPGGEVGGWVGVGGWRCAAGTTTRTYPANYGEEAKRWA
jgi:hypothetical protein